MMRALRSASSTVARIHSAVMSGSVRVARDGLRAGFVRARGAGSLIAVRSSAVLASSRDGAHIDRVIGREFSTTAALFADVVSGATDGLAFLSAERRQQLEGKPLHKQAAEDALAAVNAAENHPSRTLIERLIADDAAWRSMVFANDWRKLVDKGAKWEDLAAMLAKDGADKVKDELLAYGLKCGAATTVVSLMKWGKSAGLAHVVSTNGGLLPSVEGRFVYVDPGQDNSESLLPLIMSGDAGKAALILIHGPRSSGKSTHLYRAAQQLQSLYEVFQISYPPIERFIETPNLPEFWRVLHVYMMDLCRARGLKRAASAKVWKHGSDFFAWLRADHFGGRRVVLCCDEFDRLYSAHPVLRNHFLQTLRDLRDNTSNLQAFIGVGSFALLDFVGDSNLRIGDRQDNPMSPFNSRNTVQIKYFDPAQCRDFNAQFERFRGVKVAPDVLQDIIELTGRHPGLFALCYSHMEEWLLQGHHRPHESLDAWLPLRRSLVSGGELLTYPTMKKMEADLNMNTPLAAAARDLLSSLLTATEPFIVRGEELSSAAFLARIGVLRMSNEEEWKIGEGSETKFQFSSPLVRPLAEGLVFQRTAQPSVPMPRVPDADGRLRLDMAAILRLALSSLNRKDLQRVLATDRNTKAIDGGRAWGEFSLHFRLARVLENWLPSDVTLNYEVLPQEGRSRKRVDIMLEHQGQRVLVDLLSSATAEEMQAHVENLDLYAERLKPVSEAWLFNVTLRGALPSTTGVPERRRYRLRALHALVDREFRRADFVLDVPGEPLRIVRGDLTLSEFDGRLALEHSVGVDH